MLPLVEKRSLLLSTPIPELQERKLNPEAGGNPEDVDKPIASPLRERCVHSFLRSIEALRN